MIKSAYDIIMEGVEKLGGQQKITADHIMIQCPFHEGDHTPSCGIYIAEGMSIPIGSFNCFGCDEHGSWNTFAERLGLKGIKKWQTQITQNGVKSNSIETSFTTITELLASMRVRYIDWPSAVSWRGFEGKVLKEVDGIMINEQRRPDVLSVFFPVYINKTLQGGVKAALKKEANSLPYVTTSGTWVKKYGVFGYNAAKRMRKDYVILTEGPRDALRLIENGLPGIAILGANNFSTEKALMLTTLCPDIVYTMPDNDEAGEKMRKTVKGLMSPYCKVRNIRLPEGCKDPEQLQEDDIDDLKEMLDGI